MLIGLKQQKGEPLIIALTSVLILKPVLPFSKLNKIFLGYFDPENIFLDNENN